MGGREGGGRGKKASLLKSPFAHNRQLFLQMAGLTVMIDFTCSSSTWVSTSVGGWEKENLHTTAFQATDEDWVPTTMSDCED